MNIPCNSQVDCDCSESPFANLTSEEAERRIFIGLNWGWGWNFPRLGSNWVKDSCLGICESEVSQADADLCAALANLVCIQDTWGPPGTVVTGGPFYGPPVIPPPSTPLTVLYNAAQAYSVLCPDGSPFTWGISAGVVGGANQASADAIAFSLAQQGARLYQICLSSITGRACQNEAYNETIRATRDITSWSIASGSLPDGITAEVTGARTYRLQGTPTTLGNYTFAVRASNSSAIYMQKSYTIKVLGVTNGGTLPTATTAGPYSFSFIGAGGTAPYTYATDPEGGQLPDGITMTTAGVMSGTPTTNGEYDFVLNITDSDGATCSIDCQITVGACNAERSGTQFCPGDPTKWANIVIPQSTYCEDDIEAANAAADEDLVNQLNAALAAQGCVCNLTVNGKAITINCLTRWFILRSDGGYLAPGVQPWSVLPQVGWRLDIDYQLSFGIPLPPDVYTFVPNNYSGPSFTIDFRT